MAKVLNSVASAVASAATCTAGVVLTGTAVVAGAAGNAAKGVGRRVLGSSAAKGVAKAAGGAVAGAMAASTAGIMTLNAVGFTAVGPAAGTYATAWMSSAAIANGGAVAAGSLYSAVQATAMSGGILLGSPVVVATGAVVGALAVKNYL